MALKLQSFTQSKKIPGAPVLPIIGSLPFLGKHQYLTLTNLAKKHGDVFQIRIFSNTVVVLNRLETIRQALLRQQDDFAGRPQLYTLQNLIGGNSLGGRDYGLLWKRHREIAVSALHKFLDNKIIEQQVMEEAFELMNILLNYKGQPFDPEIDLGLSVANVMSKILFGEKYSRDDQDLIALVQYAKVFTSNNTSGALIAAMNLINVPQVHKFFKQKLEKWLDITKLLQRVIIKKLKEHQASYNPENLRGVADALLKAASEIDESDKQTLGLTEERIARGTVEEMMGTGLQPIAPILRWILLYMIAYPDIQAEVQQELDSVVGREQRVYYEDRKKLPFTEACIYEILRHAPYFPITIPHSTTTDTTINGYFIPKDTSVLINLYSLTRDERYWEEPEKFNPQRFLTESGEVREDLLDKYYPFGLGKRRCLAEHLGRLEIFIFFSNLMHRCKFESFAGEQLSFEGIQGAVVTPKAHKVIVKRRF